MLSPSYCGFSAERTCWLLFINANVATTENYPSSRSVYVSSILTNKSQLDLEAAASLLLVLLVSTKAYKSSLQCYLLTIERILHVFNTTLPYLYLVEKYVFSVINKTQGHGTAFRKKQAHDSASPWRMPFHPTYNDIFTSVKTCWVRQTVGFQQ